MKFKTSLVFLKLSGKVDAFSDIESIKESLESRVPRCLVYNLAPPMRGFQKNVNLLRNKYVPR